MNELEPIKLISLCFNFWQLVVNSADELAKSGNHSSMAYEGFQNPTQSEFENHTKWSDLRIAEPVLFNFYHGIELSLKALIVAKDKGPQGGHELSKLANRVEELYSDPLLNKFYSRYIETPKLHLILQEFCHSSKADMDLFYQSLKYPSARNGSTFNHLTLRARLEEGTELFTAIKRDIEEIKPKLEQHIVAECQLS